MHKIRLDEIVGLERYEQLRDEFRRRIIALKRNRRVPVGDRLTFVFENHDTMLFQTQEMLRAEHIADIDKVREELAVYNDLVPNPGELSATLLIEITDSDRIREDLQSLIGIDEHVFLEVGDDKIQAAFEPGRSDDERLSAVQYVRFDLPPHARERFVAGEASVRLIVDHPRYKHATALEGPVRESLAADLLP